MIKLNVLLGTVEQLSSPYKQAIKDYITFFTKSQGAFKGIKKTYIPKPDTQDLPSERESKKVVTTVQEKLNWLVETNGLYIDNLFKVEATNGGGGVTAMLIVDDVEFGSLNSLELLRLISLLESEDLENMYKNIPVRSDAEIWNQSTNEMYKDRPGIWEQPMNSGIKNSIIKREYIMKNPNINPDLPSAVNQTPVKGVEDILFPLGDWTIQHFSGEISQREKAEMLRWRSKLLVAAKAALKTANEAVVGTSNMTAAKLFGYLHTGKV